jgi:hypothetical protein
MIYFLSQAIELNERLNPVPEHAGFMIFKDPEKQDKRNNK